MRATPRRASVCGCWRGSSAPRGTSSSAPAAGGVGPDRPGGRARASLPVIVPAVPVDDRDRVRIDVVEAVEVDRDEVAPDLFQVAAPEAVDAAAAAEEALRDLGAPLICRELSLAGDQAEGGRLHQPGAGR